MKKIQVRVASDKTVGVYVFERTGSLGDMVQCASELHYETGHTSRVRNRGNSGCIDLNPIEIGADPTTLRPARIISFDDDDEVRYGIEPLGD